MGTDLFVIGVLSFADARPRSSSDIDCVENDEWQVGGMFAALILREQAAAISRRTTFVADACRRPSSSMTKGRSSSRP
jgi:hypothetical protein